MQVVAEFDAGALKITPMIGGGILIVIPEEGEVQKTPLVYPAVAVRDDAPQGTAGVRF